MIHNISIATADDVTYFGDDACIFTQDNYHLGMLSQLVREKKRLFQTNFFYQFIVN